MASLYARWNFKPRSSESAAVTVVEDGSHEELLASGGRYAEMWSAFVLSGQNSSRFSRNVG